MSFSFRQEAIQNICNRRRDRLTPLGPVRIEDIFGVNAFTDDEMRARLPKQVYKSLRTTIGEGKALDLNIAESVAIAMRDWAVERGATHYTHWFQPMTGGTAEKHDSFIDPVGDGSNIVMEFSGSSLIQGEPDASSFPSGGIRATCEARGYTAWDPTSPAFLRENANGLTLVIPTAFYSYTGEALDKKTPLLRSMDALSDAAVRVLRLIGYPEVSRVRATVGAEQEYFLIDRNFYVQRPDLMSCGRTLFGAQPARGQQLDDHYFVTIKPRVLNYMQEVERELYMLGIPVKTRHNEVAPAQYELAAVYETANIASDHNMIVLEVLRGVAERHDLACLTHEKPFAAINGSGKHNNWSLADDLGTNLLEPGETPHENAKFLVFLTAVIKGLDEYNDLFRASVANHGNDHRLGANEAPPAIISTFLGEQLTNVVDVLTGVKKSVAASGQTQSLGVTTLPPLPKHNTDRNRTSPFAFTGNKFEFRAVGSNQNIALPNFVLNTIVADSLEQIGDEIEKELGKKGAQLHNVIESVVSKNLKKHKRVIFNGDNYSREWEIEAKKRGLKNLKNSVDALAVFGRQDSLDLFARHNVLSPRESESRVTVLFDNYGKALRIEALMTRDLARARILPAAVRYQRSLAETINATKSAGVRSAQNGATKTLKKVVGLINELEETIYTLDDEIGKADKATNEEKTARAYGKKVVPAMAAVRSIADELELIVDDEHWPFPKYNEMLFVH